MITPDAYKEQNAIYEFARNFVFGKVLDLSYGSFMSYHGAKILLEGRVTEVWAVDISTEPIEYAQRKRSANGTIELQVFDYSETTLLDKSFDCIISSQTIQYVKDYNQTTREFYRILKDNGVLIISISNKSTLSLLYSKFVNEFIVNEFTKDEFIQLLEKIFPNVILYSQRLISRKEGLTKYSDVFFSIVEKIRIIMRDLLLKVRKVYNLYKKLHIQSTVLNMDRFASRLSDIVYDREYTPTPYQHEHKPLFFVAVCSKNEK